MNIVGYARVSSREQAIRGFSIDEQERRIREYVELYYGNEKDVNFRMMREEGASARSMNRPLISEIISQLYQNEINVLIIHNLDRLTRCVKDLHIFLDLISQSGAELVSIKENIDTTTPQGKFFVSLIVLIAQWEEDTISERTIRGLQESANQGNYSKPKVPQGYYRDPKNTRKLLIDSEKSNIIKQIFEKIADGSETAFSLACKLRAEKILGKKWTDTAVIQLVQNKVYYGTLQSRRGELEGHSPAIISKELWDKANKKIANKGYKQHIYIYKNKVRCIKCDHLAIQTGTTKPSGKVYLYYVCPKCKQSISENVLMRLTTDELTPLYAEDRIGGRVNYLNRRINMLKNEQHNLLYGVVESGIDYDYMCSKVMLLSEQIDVDQDEKIKLKESIKGITFISLDTIKKRDLVNKYVSEIKVDFSEKAISIKYSDYFTGA